MLFKNIRPLVLASQSPRRVELLRRLGLDFIQKGADVDESPLPSEEPEAYCLRLAGEKAAMVARDYVYDWVLAADTIVVREGRILGKPRDQDEACSMLQALAGNWHQVITAFSLHNLSLNSEFSCADATQVRFSVLSPSLIAAYVGSGEPMDKAGAYAMQELGAFFVEGIKGSPTTVIGLPLPLVVSKLLEFKIIAV
ncbi:MAG TPA: septum formation protein Maf [Proteobacteria bacterium]|nr:septum formation protein Maf [Pseudomonadota bacterium]